MGKNKSKHSISNGTIMQYFEWYLPNDSTLWKKVSMEAKNLADVGITALWLPPAYKANGGNSDVGYAVYDLYDLGEFKQKGSIPTKYGTKDEYLKAISDLHKVNIQVYADVSLDHMIGADEAEEVLAVEDDRNNRNNDISGEEKILAWTKFNFPGRNNKYSEFKWNYTHFDGVDYDESTKKSSIYRLCGKNWDECVDTENGNYDYLMGADLQLSNIEVVETLEKWGSWYINQTKVDGFRLDAVKHISYKFLMEWLTTLRNATGKELFSVGEYWNSNIDTLINYINESEGDMSLFDVPLHFNFHNASSSNGNFDMRNILKGTLTERNSVKSVTFVDNHDTQLGQALESWVQAWFKPIAYSIILLRQDGYPSVFYGDYYGVPSQNIQPMKDILDKLLKARTNLAYGKQNDYFDDFNIVGWTREGIDEYENSGLAVVLSDGQEGSKRMYIGKQFAGSTFYDCLCNRNEEIIIGDDGFSDFYVSGGSVSVWIKL